MDSCVHFSIQLNPLFSYTTFLYHVEYESFTTEGGKEVVVQQRYKGLLLSSCQSVPMFSLCNNMKEEAVKQTHGKRSPESNFDCRQLREKWLFFTEEVSIKGNPIISVIAPYPFRYFSNLATVPSSPNILLLLQFCPRKLLKCTMKPHCSGISCKCCEEIRCLSAVKFLDTKSFARKWLHKKLPLSSGFLHIGKKIHKLITFTFVGSKIIHLT